MISINQKYLKSWQIGVWNIDMIKCLYLNHGKKYLKTILFVTFEQCIGLDKSITNSYLDFGYNPIEVVRGSIDDRVDFILENI